MHFEHNGIKIACTDSPYLIRINKQVGMFAVGMLDASDIKSINTYGRGKWIELVVVNCETGLWGTIGKASNKEWAFVSGIVTSAEDERLKPGLLISFPVYGFEARDFSTMQSEAEIAAIFGDAKDAAKVIRLEFSKSVATQHGSTIKPPTIVVKDAGELERKYFDACEVLRTQHGQYIPDPLDLHPATYDDKTGQMVSGLIRTIDRIAPSLPAAEPPKALVGNGKKAALPTGKDGIPY